MTSIEIISGYNKSLIFVAALLSVSLLVTGLISIPSISHYAGNKYSPELGGYLFWTGLFIIGALSFAMCWHAYNAIRFPAALYVQNGVLHYYTAWPEKINLEQISAIKDPIRKSMFGFTVNISLKDGRVRPFQTAMMSEKAIVIVERLRSKL